MADWLAPELEGRDLDVVGVVSSLPAVGERGGALRVRGRVSARRRAPAEEAPAFLAPHAVRGGRRGDARAGRASRASAGCSPCGCAGRMATSIPTASITKPGCSSAASARRATCGRRASAGASDPATAFSITWNSAREAVRDRFQAQLGATPAAGILAALAVGDQRAISAEEWRLFNRTGVTHLMSISGLHVTLVSGLAAWLVAFGWRRVPAAALRLPARKAAAAAAIVAALGYTLLAGFAVPAQRTFYMVAVVARGAMVRPHRLAVAHARAGARRDRCRRSVGAARAGPVAVVRRGGAHLLRRPGGLARHAVDPHAMGDHRRARAGGAASLRPGVGRRAARQCGRHSGGVGRRDAARAAWRRSFRFR